MILFPEMVMEMEELVLLLILLLSLCILFLQDRVVIWSKHIRHRLHEPKHAHFAKAGVQLAVEVERTLKRGVLSITAGAEMNLFKRDPKLRNYGVPAVDGGVDVFEVWNYGKTRQVLAPEDKTRNSSRQMEALWV